MTQDSKVVAGIAAKRRPPAAGMGRKKGVPNKSTKAVKEALELAFQGLGGVPKLIEWAEANPTEFFKLWVKMLPTEISGPGGGPIETHEITERMASLPKDRRDALRAAIKAAMETK